MNARDMLRDVADRLSRDVLDETDYARIAALRTLAARLDLEIELAPLSETLQRLDAPIDPAAPCDVPGEHRRLCRSRRGGSCNCIPEPAAPCGTCGTTNPGSFNMAGDKNMCDCCKVGCPDCRPPLGPDR